MIFDLDRPPLFLSLRGKSTVEGQKLETVTSFKNLGAMKAQKPDVLSRTAKVTEIFTLLRPIWSFKNIFLGSKVKLMDSFFISVFCMLVSPRH